MRFRGPTWIACLALCLGVIIAPSTPQSARADETATPARVSITGLAPVALGRGNSISVSGAVANTSLTTITDVSVRLTFSTVPVSARRELRKATEIDGAYGSIPIYATLTPVTEALIPGAKASYRVTTDTDQLPLAQPGVYVIGVEAIGYGSAGLVILDSSRTLIPYVPEAPDPVNLTWLWPLATAPAQTPDGVLLGDAVAREVSPGGRLAELLAAGTSSPAMSWVVDPQLLQVTADMSDGYLVEKGGRVRAGVRAQGAADWLAQATGLLGPPDRRKRPGSRPIPLWVMPYADPDADALTREGAPGEANGFATDLVRSTTLAPELAKEVLGREPDGTLAWGAGGRLTPAALDVLSSTGVRTVVLREKALTGRVGTWFTPSGYVDLEATGGRVRALVIDPGLLSALSMPQGTRSGAIDTRQRFLAELAFVALEPTEETRYLVAAPANPRWNPNPRLLRAIIASLRSTPWTRIVPVDTLLAQPPKVASGSLNSQRKRSLTAPYLARIAAVQDSIAALRRVLTDPLPVTAPITAAILRAESSAWQTRPREGNRLLDSIESSVEAAQGSVYVAPRDNVVFSGDSGSVPVTVVNDFDQSVRVGVTLTADPAARLEADALPPVTIEPGRRASLEVPVRVIGGDALTVDVQLTDPAGDSFGKPVSLELRTTAYSRAALWVAVAAAVILGLLVIFDIARRGRQRRVTAKAASA